MSLNKKVSVCAICKNSADVLPAFLHWAENTFEEVNLVVDTENDDDTIKVINNLCSNSTNYHVCYRTFDNFSTQKMIAIDLASTPWILMMDVDEILEAFDIDKFLTQIEKNREQYAHGNMKIAFTFARYNLQENEAHYNMFGPEIKVRMMRKEYAVYDGKPVDEDFAIDGMRIMNLPYAIIHYGHIRNERALHLKGKDRIKFIDKDPCDGPGLRKHGEEWFIKRNELWKSQVALLPTKLQELSSKYWELIEK